jgi:hypothetical protein
MFPSCHSLPSSLSPPTGSFYMDQPFTKGDKVHAESAADQWIRRYIYTCKFAFPHLQKRIEVVSTREQVLRNFLIFFLSLVLHLPTLEI